MRHAGGWAVVGVGRTLVLVCALLAANPGMLRAQTTYQVEGIAIEAVAADAVAAREVAIAGGQREGLRRLFQSLAAPDSRLPDTAALPIDRYVLSYEIASEQVGAASYRGSLNVTYRGPAVREALRGAGVGFLERAPPATLVVPAVARDGGLGLWWEAEAWRAALGQAVGADGPIKLLLPLGDAIDIGAVTAASIVGGDQAAAARLGERYGAPNVVLAVLEEGKGVQLRSLAGTAVPEPGREITLPPGDATASDNAARATVAALVQAIRSGATAPQGPASVVPVSVVLADLATWLQIKQALEAEPAVRAIRVTSFSRSKAELNLTYVGEVARLQEALGRRGLALLAENGRWQLQRADAQGLPRF